MSTMLDLNMHYLIEHIVQRKSKRKPNTGLNHHHHHKVFYSFKATPYIFSRRKFLLQRTNVLMVLLPEDREYIAYHLKEAGRK